MQCQKLLNSKDLSTSLLNVFAAMNQRRSFLSMEKIDIPHNKATNNLQNNTELNYKSGLNEDVSMLELKKPSKAKVNF